MSIFLNSNKKLRQSGLNNNTLTKCIGDGWNNAAYSRKWMNTDNETDIYSWNIKINKGNRNIYVGIVSNLHHQQNKDFDTKHSYVIDMTNGRMNINGIFQGFPGHKCGEGDIFTFTLNLQQKQLECIKNYDVSGKKILAKNIKIDENIAYRLALNIYYKENKVTVTDNKVINDDDDDHMDDDHIDAVWLVKDEKLEETVQCIKKLENQILRMQKMLKNQYQTLQQKYFIFSVI